MTDKEILAYISDIKKEVEQTTNFETIERQKIIFMLGKLHEEVYYQQIYTHLNHVLENDYDYDFRIIIKNLEKDPKFLEMSDEERITQYRDIQNCIKNIQLYDISYKDLCVYIDSGEMICTKELLKKIDTFTSFYMNIKEDPESIHMIDRYRKKTLDLIDFILCDVHLDWAAQQQIRKLNKLIKAYK
jgi:hypothetical protein